MRAVTNVDVFRNLSKRSLPMRTRVMVSLAVALLLSACGTSKTGQAQQPVSKAPPSGGMSGDMMADGGMHGSMMEGDEHHGQMGSMADMCPMQIKGTTASAEDVEGGAAINFTTTADVAEVRSRIAKMVAMHTNMHGRGMGGGMAGDGGMAMRKGEMMAATVKSDDIEGGARVVFTPTDATKLDALRAEVRDHATKMMAAGDCPMMMIGGKAMP